MTTHCARPVTHGSVESGGAVLVPPRLRELWRIARDDRGPVAALMALLVLAHGLVLPVRYGFLDDYALLYTAEVDPNQSTSHILGGGRPVFALTERVLFGLLTDIGDLRYIRALTLLLTCGVALVLFSLLRAVRTVPWTAAGTVGLLMVLPSTQVSVAWATMFIIPVSMLLALCASAALQREVQLTGRLQPRRMLLPVVLLSLAVTAYQPAAMSFWLGFAVLALGVASVRDDLAALLRLTAANLAVFAGALVVGFVALKIGVATQGIVGARTGTVTDPLGKLEWFFGEALPRPLDPWSLTPRPVVVLSVVTLLIFGIILLPARGPGRRLLALALAMALVVASYLPNLLVAENWASTRTMAALMPMVALLATFAARAVISAVASLARASAAGHLVEQVVVGLAALAFAVHAADVVQRWFVVPQKAELAAAERAVAAIADPQDLVVVPSEWFDSLAPTQHYDEFGIPSSAQPGPALGLTQLLVRERTGRFASGVRVLPRTDRAVGPATGLVLDYRDVLAAAPAAPPAPAALGRAG